jgi:hypothetical protein
MTLTLRVIAGYAPTFRYLRSVILRLVRSAKTGQTGVLFNTGGSNGSESNGSQQDAEEKASEETRPEAAQEECEAGEEAEEQEEVTA